MRGWEVVNGLWSFLNGVFDEASPELAPYHLQPKSLAVLALIETHRYPAVVANQLGMPMPTLSHYLTDMESEGLITRSIDAEDRRRFLMSLTPAGQKAKEAGLKAIESGFDRRMDQLPPEVKDQVMRALDVMLSTRT